MNTKQLELLATEVMKWWKTELFYGSGDTEIMDIIDWQPHNDIAQAMMLLEKLDRYGWVLYSDVEDYVCYINSGERHTSHCKCEAICEAVLSFKDYNEEN